MKNLQLWLHQHRDDLKFGLIVIGVFVGFIILFNILRNQSLLSEAIRSNEQQSIERTRATRQIINTMKEENEGQTRTINRQFRALCILIIEISGQEGLDQLDPESRKRCENLSADDEPVEPTPPPTPGENTNVTILPNTNNSTNQPNNNTNNGGENPPPEPGVLVDLPNRLPDIVEKPLETVVDRVGGRFVN